MRLCGYVMLFVAGFLLNGNAFAQAAIEGKVELPRQSVERVANQRYQNSAEAPTGPPDPPMAVVYLQGDFAKSVGPSRSAAMAQKNINFDPGLLPIRVGTTV